MRKQLFVLGLILLFTGTIVAACFRVSSKVFAGEELRGTAEIYWVPHRRLSGRYEWRARVNVTFNAGEIISVVVSPNSSNIGWGNIFIRSQSPKSVNVTIGREGGGTALFKIFFSGEVSQETGDIVVGVYNYTLVQCSDDIEVRFKEGFRSLEEAGGVVKRGGIFIVEVAPNPEQWAMIPPDDVSVYNLKYREAQPYWFLLPFGLVLDVFGFLAIYYSRRKKRLRGFMAKHFNSRKV